MKKKNQTNPHAIIRIKVKKKNENLESIYSKFCRFKNKPTICKRNRIPIPIVAKSVTCFIAEVLIYAKFANISDTHKFSEENFEAVDGEDANIADFAALPGGEQLHVAPATVEIVAQ